VTNEEQAAMVAALVEEKRKFETYGPEERLAQVNAQLAELGAAGASPEKRAEKRPAKKKTETK
jgi:hypothetical protein